MARLVAALAMLLPLAHVATASPGDSPGAEPQQQSVTGTVTDADSGEPLPGTNIRVKGTSTGTITDVDGRYSVRVNSLQDTLVFSFVGFTPLEEPIAGRSTIDVSLYPAVVFGDELVVIGYGVQQRRDVTGSISSVEGEELGELPVATVSEALQGRAAGLQVVSSGVPGSDATFRIRGTSTIGNSNPLVVIDGIPTTAGLNQINPNDVESVEVLKDASATAIYGSRGANGVVIVTTKSGSSERQTLDIEVSTGIQQATDMVEMLDAASFARLHNEMMQNAGLPTNPAFADPDALGTDTDWLDQLFGTAPMQSLSASYSGGGETTTFYVSGNVLHQDGIVDQTGFRRYTLQLNTDTRLFDRLSFGNKLTLNHDVNRSGSYNIRNTMYAQPTQPVMDESGKYTGPQGRPEWVGDIINPIGQARLIENGTTGYNVIGSVFGELEVVKNLTLRSTLGLQANFWDSNTWAPAYDWQPSPQEDAYRFEQYNKSLTWLFDNTLTYDRFFGASHHLTALLGTSVQENTYRFMNGSVQGFPSDVTRQLDNGVQEPTLNGNEASWGLASVMGRVNYSFKDTYLLTATLRRDGSSRFGEGNKWGLFPSASVAWRLSNESFLSGADWLDDLKLRLGYGSTGNQEIGNYAFASALQTIQYNFGGNLVSAVVPVVMPNPGVHWESVEQFNVGADATVFDDRVRLSVDAYLKNTTGMLVPGSVPVTTGYSDILVPYINAGEMRNEGIEFTLSTDNLRGRVDWTTDFNISFNRNEVVSLNDTIPMSSGEIDFNYSVARIQAGQPIGAFYGYVTNGIFQTPEEVARYAVQVPGADPYNSTSPGDLKFVDLNNDGVIDDSDRTFLGNPNPDVILGFHNRIAFGGFDLSVFLQGAFGHQIYNANRVWVEGMASAYNQTTAVEDRWTGEGTSDEMPRAVYGDPNGNMRVSDRYVEDGSYLRLKNVTIGYTLPARLTQQARMSRARVYLTANNLLTITGYSGFDPEVPVSGIDNNVYPIARTITAGISVGF